MTKALSIHEFVRNIFVASAFLFVLSLYQLLMYSFDLKSVDKVVYRRENSSVQAKVLI
jgi:hypothetical protein